MRVSVAAAVMRGTAFTRVAVAATIVRVPVAAGVEVAPAVRVPVAAAVMGGAALARIAVTATVMGGTALARIAVAATVVRVPVAAALMRVTVAACRKFDYLLGHGERLSGDQSASFLRNKLVFALIWALTKKENKVLQEWHWAAESTAARMNATKVLLNCILDWDCLLVC